MQTLEAILARHPFFEGFEAHSMQFITGCASNVRFAAGEYIFHEGEAASHFYIIRQGKVALEAFAAQRGPITIETIEPAHALAWHGLSPPSPRHSLAPC